MLKLEEGPADPVGPDGMDSHWDVLTPNVNTGGAPWAYGAFKYPYPLGGNTYVGSYTLPAATEGDVDYGLYTFTLKQEGAGTDADPATISVTDLTFLYNDPDWNEYDAQLLAPRDPAPIVPSTVDMTQNSGIILANDIFNRGTNDGQERPVQGVDQIDEIAVIVGIPTVQGEPDDFSANEFEKRALLGFAPVQSDGSFRIEVPADLPISFATLDQERRAFVNKRTWMYVRPGEEISKCSGCHQDRLVNQTLETNPNPIAATLPPTDLVKTPAEYRYINFRDHIGPVVEAKCATCHFQTITMTDSILPDSSIITVIDTIPPPGGLDLTSVLDTLMMGGMGQVFPRAYINLSGEQEMGPRNVVSPAFPRRSILIDYVLGLGAAQPQGPHPQTNGLTPQEQEMFNLWVTLGAQYR